MALYKCAYGYDDYEVFKQSNRKNDYHLISPPNGAQLEGVYLASILSILLHEELFALKVLAGRDQRISFTVSRYSFLTYLPENNLTQKAQLSQLYWER